MANQFWNFVTQMIPGTLAKAEDVNANLTGVEAGFDSVETEIAKAIQITDTPGSTDIDLSPGARASKILAFDSGGNVIATEPLGEWRGDHADAAGTQYYVRDIVRDAAGRIGINNLYMCNTAHVSTGTINDDQANFDIIVNVSDIADLEADAAASATLAYQWAEWITGIVDSVGYSARAWANGGTGVTDTAGRGAAKEWATKAEDSTVDTVEYSAKHYSAKASASASAAAASAAELQGYDPLVFSASMTFDFDGDQTQYTVCTGNLTTTATSNRAGGKSFTLILSASGADRTITYNASWVQIGSLPTTIPNGKYLMLSFVCIGSSEASVLVTGAVEY